MNSVKIYGNFGSRVPQRAHQASRLRGKRKGTKKEEGTAQWEQRSQASGHSPPRTSRCLPHAVAGLGCRVRDQSDSGTPEVGWELIPDAEASTLQRAKDCG